MMCAELALVYLPEPSHLLGQLPSREDPNHTIKADFLLKRDLRARKKAHSHVRLSDCSESSRDGVVELRRYQLVSDLRGSGCDEVQTVVTH
jgi:hypothetical protein